MKSSLWEILVPTVKDPNKKGPKGTYSTRYHRIWDKKVMEICGVLPNTGLTIQKPAKGQWIAMSGEAFSERMIPVKIYCTLPQIWWIAGFTAQYYKQQAIMFYKVSDEVYIQHYGVKET